MKFKMFLVLFVVVSFYGYVEVSNIFRFENVFDFEYVN